MDIGGTFPMREPTEHFDVAIVGAGVAGALLAHQLALNKHRVVLLEAGSAGADRISMVQEYALDADKTPRSPYKDAQPPSPVESPNSETDYIHTPGPYKFKSTYLRRLGGSTWHMLGNMPRFLPADFRLHEKYGRGADWPIGYDDLESWYGRAEWELGVAGDHTELNGMHGAYRTKPFPMSKIWPAYGDLQVITALNGMTDDEGTAVSISTTPQARNSRPYDGRPACAGNSSCVPLCPIGAKYDASVHVHKARREKVDIRERAVVSRIMLNETGQRVTSLQYIRWDENGNRKITTLSASFVVIAAHAIETARLLLLSQDDKTAPTGVANRSDQVGRNLMDHLQGQGATVVAKPLYPFRGPPTTVGIDTFRDGCFRREYAAFRMSIGNDGMGRAETPALTLANLLKSKLIGKELRDALRYRVTRQFRISYSTEMLPHADNRVALAPPDQVDAFELRRAQLSFNLDEYNRVAFAKAQAIISAIFDRLGAASGPDDRKFTAQNTYSGAGHIIGTTRMGRDAGGSVVDADCRTHDHDNLYVVGASVFSTSGTANPTLTVAALALRAAETIHQRLRRAA